MSALMTVLQSQLDDSSASLDRQLSQSQKTTQQMIKKSHDAIFAQMGEMLKIITELGKHVQRLNLAGTRDQEMAEQTTTVTPLKGEKPDFEIPESRAKKSKTEQMGQGGNLTVMLRELQQQQTMLENKTKEGSIPAHPAKPAEAENTSPTAATNQNPTASHTKQTMPKKGTSWC